MKIKSITFKAPEPKLKIIKNVFIYISEKHSQIIIAPFYKEPNQGYRYSQEKCEVLPLNSPYEAIGESIKRNIQKFDIKEYDSTRSSKKDGYTAFHSSKEKSMRGFEKNYTLIDVSGLTDRNNTFRIQTRLGYINKLEITSTISAHCDNAELGKLVMRMFNSEIVDRT
ncbi:hypothetical protein [Allomuricauda sp. SCSIO 65647]|uniref:hypothetical protein n=1 Tax=Allomuricauda sp. SCSIO 65647 TaxID=2908843 RepID=UPI001F2EBE8A|nr:hypothetical protein [Muricauda sp. SCSIO 65647]UJH68623.1 hypothetical protein L0P89_05265 [Muricauda sp. SCSIO 65647]